MCKWVSQSECMYQLSNPIRVYGEFDQSSVKNCQSTNHDTAMNF